VHVALGLQPGAFALHKRDKFRVDIYNQSRTIAATHTITAAHVAPDVYYAALVPQTPAAALAAVKFHLQQAPRPLSSSEPSPTQRKTRRLSPPKHVAVPLPATNGTGRTGDVRRIRETVLQRCLRLWLRLSPLLVGASIIAALSWSPPDLSRLPPASAPVLSTPMTSSPSVDTDINQASDLESDKMAMEETVPPLPPPPSVLSRLAYSVRQAVFAVADSLDWLPTWVPLPRQLDQHSTMWLCFVVGLITMLVQVKFLQLC